MDQSHSKCPGNGPGLFGLCCLLLSFGALIAEAQVQGIPVNSNPVLHQADSMFYGRNWKEAKSGYLVYLRNPDPATAALTWNRLGYCNHNLGLYEEALKDYDRSLASHPAPPLKAVVEVRMSEVYSAQRKIELSLSHMDSAVQAGFANISELDTCRLLDPIKSSAKFKSLYDTVYGRAYPCIADEKARQFDFWIGEWDVYNPAKVWSGRSVIQRIS